MDLTINFMVEYLSSYTKNYNATTGDDKNEYFNLTNAEVYTLAKDYSNNAYIDTKNGYMDELNEHIDDLVSEYITEDMVTDDHGVDYYLDKISKVEKLNFDIVVYSNNGLELYI